MARKTSLREYQLSVANRLRDLATRKAVASMLGFQVGTERWFVDLTDISEVIPVPAIMPVPLTQDWFCGVANVRGTLYSIADFAAFQGQAAIGSGVERRVILISEKRISGSGLLVNRMLGLRNPDQFSSDTDSQPAPPWVKGVYRDPNGERWHWLHTEALVRDERFLEAGR